MMEQPEQAALLLIGLGLDLQQRVAGIVNGLAEPCLIQRRVGNNHADPLAVRSRDLFDRELLADGIVDVALAHSAHHTVNFQSGLCHKNYLLIGGLAPAK